MSITRSDALALLLALGAAIASLVVWDYGRVDIGMTLRTDQGRVVVDQMTPDGNALRSGFFFGTQIIDLTTVDGTPVKRGQPLEIDVGGAVEPVDIAPWEYLGPIGAEIDTFDRDYRLPIEAVASERIDSAIAGDVDPDAHWINAYATIDRGFLEFQLHESLWLMGFWLLLGVLVWRLLVHGISGDFGRRHALKLGVAVAAPALIWPVIQVGTAPGIAAGYLVPAAVALVLAWSFDAQHPDRQWVQTGRAGAFVAAALAAILVVRYLTAGIYSDDRDTILVLIAAVPLIPAVVAATVPSRSWRERAQLGSLALIPAAAMTIQGDRAAQVAVPFALLALLLGWQVAPFERAFALVGGGLSRVRSIAPTPAPAPADPGVVTHEPIVSAGFRDMLTIALFALVVLFGIIRQDSAAFVVVGVLLAGIVGFAIQRGFLGEHWADAAIPLAVAVGLPVAVAGYESWTYGGQMGWVSTAFALTGLSVAHVLAGRHSDPSLGRRLMFWTVALAALSVVMWSVWGSGGNEPLAFVVACLVPLVPGLPVAFAADHDEPRAISTRLETLVVALTLLLSASVLTPLAWVPPVAWLIAIVVWRRFTLAPLLGLAQRTQLQRDLAVAAAETERARLAADLHDDALQQLTMLVRTLDESGQKEAAEQAREVATKLRSVVGDLRLPILDDLGAGAALEWLVERVEPLAGGPVKLERSDETRPPANVELAVFRVAQEALTNAIKHGKPPIAVRYDVRGDGRVTLAIDDAGEGIAGEAAEEAPKAGHFGLANMQQRAEQIGALLDVRRWPAGGTRVALEWRPQ